MFYPCWFQAILLSLSLFILKVGKKHLPSTRQSATLPILQSVSRRVYEISTLGCNSSCLEDLTHSEEIYILWTCSFLLQTSILLLQLSLHNYLVENISSCPRRLNQNRSEVVLLIFNCSLFLFCVCFFFKILYQYQCNCRDRIYMSTILIVVFFVRISTIWNCTFLLWSVPLSILYTVDVS